jgi:electron transfer flavoprotein alpha subunit
MLALVVVRDGSLPAGGDEVVAECGGRVLLIGSGTAAALDDLRGAVTDARLVEAGAFRPGAWSAGLAVLLADDPVVVLPHSADGRDLAPRLAHALDRPLLAHAMVVGTTTVELIRAGGTELHSVVAPAAFVATLHPGLRGVERTVTTEPNVREQVLPDATDAIDAEVVATFAADAATLDLAEAPRIVAGGAGLDSADRFEQLAALGAVLGASVGATRVVTDRGWVGHDRQIGTTGVVVDPQLYLAFGISGAVQHTSGLGAPAHVISVNTDAHCPMMQLADLAIVADANATLDALLARLGTLEVAHG